MNSNNVEVLTLPSGDGLRGKLHAGLDLFKGVFRLIGPYWRSEEKAFAWVGLVVVVALNFSLVYLSVLFNRWNGDFFNALEGLDHAAYMSLLYKFCGLVLAMIIAYVSQSYSQNYLVFRWRIWFTKNMLGRWLDDSTFCKLFTMGAKTENPDQRISEDIASFTESSMMLFVGILKESVNAITFGVILWGLSKGITLAAFGMPAVAIPGYMLWLTIIYVGFATFFIYKTGRPLVKLDYIKERVEANFRFSLMRIRDRRSEVAILNGGHSESLLLNGKLHDIISNFHQILKRVIYINTLQNLFGNATNVLPYIAAAPMFFAGSINLGDLMRLGAAFGAVEMSLMYFMDNINELANWKANFNRITDFSDEMTSVAAHKGSDLQVHMGKDKELQLNLELYLPKGNKLFGINLDMIAGEKVLVMGRSGLGKSTLTKAIVGQWPYAIGNIVRPHSLFVLPQKPYFPITSLRETVLYPNLHADVADSEIIRVLKVCCLEKLVHSLDEVKDWNAELSLGEQQRLNFARVILSRATFLILDEPTASVNKDLEREMFRTLLAELPTASILTISHSIALQDIHDRVVTLG